MTMPYKLTIIPDGTGGYVGRLDSEDGDLWAKLEQQPQVGNRFRQALITFAVAYGIPFEIIGAGEPTAQVPQIEMPADVERATRHKPLP